MCLYRNLRAQFFYRVGSGARFSVFRTRGGAKVPLVISTGQGHLGVFLIKDDSEITRSRIASAESFLKRYESARVLFLCADQNIAHSLTERMAVCSLTRMLFE